PPSVDYLFCRCVGSNSFRRSGRGVIPSTDEGASIPGPPIQPARHKHRRGQGAGLCAL
ncbi:unnamed protein product, partial [Prorocentrum cordatum]